MATVLVVDDAAANRELLRTLLKYRGHRVFEAEEAREALNLARRERPDVVVTDVLMPGMDGYQLARELRADPATAATALVFYSGNYSEDELRPMAATYGVTRVVLKSADPTPLLQAVDEVLAEARPTLAEQSAEEFHREHVQAVNSKLVETVEQLHSSEARFRAMAQSSPIGIFLTDVDGHAFFVNARLEDIMGRPAGDLLGMGWLECFTSDLREEVIAAVRGSVRPDTEHRYRLPVVRLDGSTVWLTTYLRVTRDTSGQPDGAVGIVDDVTAVVLAEERRRVDERRRESDARRRVTERLESLRRLAGGVAHDYNNVLGVILSFSEFLRETIAGESTQGRLAAQTAEGMLGDLDNIRRAGERAAGLTRQLQWFGSQIALKATAVDLNALILEQTQAIKDLVGAHIAVVTRFGPNLSGVAADPGQIGQVLANLVSNARDAMPAGGTLLIETGNHTNANGTTTTITTDGRSPAGDYVRLTVGDDGAGMTSEVAERAIEPFFTTKPRGTGAGLGLATAYGIATQAGGDLRIDSVAGHGTSVHLDLPAIARRPAERVRPTGGPAGRAAPDGTGAPDGTADGSTASTGGGGARILVVDDEDGIREVVQRVLTAAGYQVLTASDGVSALEIAERREETIDGLLTDVLMPGMHGGQLARKLTAERPGMPVLFMSGYAEPLAEDDDFDPAEATILAKPFTAGALLEALRQVLARA